MVDPGKMDPPVARTGGKRAPREVKLQVRLTRTASDYLDKLAAEEQRTRSDMARILLYRGMALANEAALEARTAPPAARPASLPAKAARGTVRATGPQEDAPAGKPLSKVEQAKAMKAAKYR